MSVFLVKEPPLNLWRQLFVTLIADDVIRAYCEAVDGAIALFDKLFFFGLLCKAVVWGF